MPYNPYGPPPGAAHLPADPSNPYGPGHGAAYLPADPSNPYGPGPSALAAAYGAASHLTGRPPGPPFPGMLGFLVLVVIGFAMNAGIGAVGMVVIALVSGANLETLSSGNIFDAVPVTALLGVLLLASLSWPGVALVGARLMREWSLGSFRLRRSGVLASLMSILMGLALVPVALALEHGMSRLVPRGRNELMEMMIRQPDALAMTILGVTLVLAAPIGEELLFRGLGLRGLERRYGFGLAAFLVSLIFSAVHLNLTGFTALFLVSVALCWVTSRTGSLIPAILLHAAYNGLQFLMLVLGDHSEAAVRKAMAEKSLGIPLWVVGGSAAIALLAGLAIHRFASRPSNGAQVKGVPDRGGTGSAALNG